MSSSRRWRSLLLAQRRAGRRADLDCGWQIVAISAVLLFALSYLRFLFALPAPTRYGFIDAGGLSVGGATSMEGLGAERAFVAADQVTYPYLVLATVEETCEMLGVMVFIATLLHL